MWFVGETMDGCVRHWYTVLVLLLCFTILLKSLKHSNYQHGKKIITLELLPKVLLYCYSMVVDKTKSLPVCMVFWLLPSHPTRYSCTEYKHVQCQHVSYNAVTSYNHGHCNRCACIDWHNNETMRWRNGYNYSFLRQ